MSALFYLKLQKGATAAPAPPPNPTSAPTISVQAPAGAGTPAPAVKPSSDPNTRSLQAAQPLTPSGNGFYQGQILPNNQIVAMQEQERLQAEEAAKNAPKPQAAPKQDTKLTDSLLSSWESRIGKLASDDAYGQDAVFAPTMPPYPQLGPPRPPIGIPKDMGAYNPFEKGTIWNGLYGGAKKYLLGKNLNVKHRGPLGDMSSVLNRSHPWTQALARHSAEIPSGNSINPILQLAGNAIGSLLGGGSIDASKMRDLGSQAGFNI